VPYPEVDEVNELSAVYRCIRQQFLPAGQARQNTRFRVAAGGGQKESIDAGYGEQQKNPE